MVHMPHHRNHRGAPDQIGRIVRLFRHQISLFRNDGMHLEPMLLGQRPDQIKPKRLVLRRENVPIHQRQDDVVDGNAHGVRQRLDRHAVFHFKNGHFLCLFHFRPHRIIVAGMPAPTPTHPRRPRRRKFTNRSRRRTPHRLLSPHLFGLLLPLTGRLARRQRSALARRRALSLKLGGALTCLPFAQTQRLQLQGAFGRLALHFLDNRGIGLDQRARGQFGLAQFFFLLTPFGLGQQPRFFFFLDLRFHRLKRRFRRRYFRKIELRAIRPDKLDGGPLGLAHSPYNHGRSLRLLLLFRQRRFRSFPLRRDFLFRRRCRRRKDL